MNIRKHSKLIASFLTGALCAGATIAMTNGCMTHRVQVVDPVTGATNIVVEVDEANLAIDTTAIAGVTSLAVGHFRNNPAVKQALTDAHVALDGIVHGSNDYTTKQVIILLQAQNDPELTRQVQAIVKIASDTEQKLLAKYGQKVAGQIALAIADSIDIGIVIGLGLPQ